MKNNRIEVGRLGKTIGLHGKFVFHLSSDFASFFRPKLQLTESYFFSTLTIKSFTSKANTFYIYFEEIDSREKANQYINAILYTTIEETRALCELQENEFFYFDIIDCEIIEDSMVLGKVCDIQHIGINDYFVVQTLDSHKPKTFMIPYIDNFVTKICIQEKQIFTKNASLILEES